MICGLLIGLGCDLSSSDPLPEDWLVSVRRTYRVRRADAVTDQNGDPLPIRALSAVEVSSTGQGADSPLVLAQRMGAKAVSLPRGLGCSLTLDQVFPDPSNDPGDDRAYHWEGLRDHLREAAARGMSPIWQTVYDIGEGACTSASGVPGVATRRVGDSETWAAVVARLTRWMNGSLNPYFPEEVRTRLAARGHPAACVEFLPDSLRLGGYQSSGIASVLGIYRSWVREIRDAFREDTAPRVVARCAPSLPLVSAGELDDPQAPVGAFLDLLRSDPSLAPDVFSVLTRSRSPLEHRQWMQSLRAHLDAAGLSSVALADTGLALHPDLWETLTPLYPTRAQRSALFAAFAAMVRLGEQDLLSLLVPERWSGPRTLPSALLGEDLFQEEDGRTLPAYAALQVFARLDQGNGERLLVTETSEVLPESASRNTPSDSLKVLAVRTSNGGVNLVVVSLPPLESPRPAIRMHYDITVEGLDALAPKGWVITRWVVDSGTVGLRGPVEQSDFSPVGGQVRIVREILGPAIHQVELAPKTG